MTSLSRKTILRTLEILLCIAISQDLLLWWFSGIPTIINFIILISIAVIILSLHRSWWNPHYIKEGILLTIIASIISILIFMHDGIGVSVSQGLPYFVGVLLFLLKDNIKYNILKYVTKIFGIVLLIAIIAYALVLALALPPYSILEKPFGLYEDHLNYIFFIIPAKFAIPRFSGPFIEPGHISIFCVFILYANRFTFKLNKLLTVYLVCVIISFSLAGYLLLILAYFIHIRFKLKVLLPTIFFCSIVVAGFTLMIDKEENPITLLILDRLAYDEEKGIAGNNRTHGATESYFNKMISSGDIIFGKGPSNYGKLVKGNILSGAGYKIYLIQYGIIGMGFVLIYYSICALKSYSLQFSLGFLLIIIICSLQRTYPSWTAWLLPYLCSFCNWKVQTKALD